MTAGRKTKPTHPPYRRWDRLYASDTNDYAHTVDQPGDNETALFFCGHPPSAILDLWKDDGIETFTVANAGESTCRECRRAMRKGAKVRHFGRSMLSNLPK